MIFGIIFAQKKCCFIIKNLRAMMARWFVAATVALLLCMATVCCGTTSGNSTTVSRRRLQVEDGGVSSTSETARARYVQKKSAAKGERMKRMLSVIKMKPFLVGNLQAEPWGAQHQAGGNAVFAVLMNYGDKLSERGDAVPFLLSLRATGYAGDIVLGMSAGYKDGFLDVVKEARCVVYTVPTECNDEVCNYVGRPDVRASVNMVRFFLYQYWTSFYEEQVRVDWTCLR